MPTERRQVGVSFVDPDLVHVIESHMGSRGRTALYLMALLAVVFVVYARALAGGFIYLDDRTVVNNPPLQVIGPGLINIWLHPTISPRYEPVSYTLLLFEYRLFKSQFAVGYLAVNILLHMANVVLMFLLLRRLEVMGAFVAVLLFAVHPMNVQAVGWISQQPLLLCGVLSLLAIRIWLRFTGIDPAPPDTGKIFRLPETRWMLFGLLVLLSAAAMGSHSMAVALPIVMGVLVWWERARLSREEWRALIPLLAISAVWVVVTSVADSRRGATVGILEADLVARLWGRAGAVGGYVWTLLFPLNLQLIYPSRNVLLMGAITLVGLAVVLAGAWRIRPWVGRGPFAVVLVVLALLLPTLFLRSDLDEWTHQADQLFYLPGAVLLAGIVAGASGLLAARPAWVGQVVAAMLVVGLGAYSIVRLGDFKSSQRLWGSVLRSDANSLLALTSLGGIELEERNFPQARERFTRALQAHPKDVRPLLQLARSYEMEGDLDKMLMRFQEAQSIAPDDLDVHLGLGTAYFAKGNFPRAIEEFDWILAKSPKHYQATYRRGLAYRGMGDLDRAVAAFEEAVELKQAEAAPYIDLANIAFARGDLDKAVARLESAARLDPTNFRIYVNVGAQLGTLAEDSRVPTEQRGEWRDRAEKYLRYAVYLNPESSEARYNLGGLLFNCGKLDEAIFQLGKAVELSPQNADFIQALRLVENARRSAGAR